MHKIEKEDIHFIETYLENSDVRYADIRLEMTDHIASAIEYEMNNGDERSFYYIFKDYMIEHKAQLLKDNKRFTKLADKRILNLLLRRTLTVPALFVFLVIAGGFSIAINYYELEVFRKTISNIPILSGVLVAIIYWIVVYSYKLNRYSAVERLIFPYLIIAQLFNFAKLVLVKQLENDTSVYIEILSLSFVFTVLLVLIKVSIETAISYSKQFKGVA